MQLPKGVEWAAHVLVILDRLQDERPVSTAELAHVHGLSGPYLSKQLQALTRHGLVVSTSGPAGGFTLGLPAEEISLAQVVEAVHGRQPLFQCTEIRCGGVFRERAEEIVANGPCRIAAAMHEAERAWRASLDQVTIHELARGIDEKTQRQLRSALTNEHENGSE